jgi:hypothetical protein
MGSISGPISSSDPAHPLKNKGKGPENRADIRSGLRAALSLALFLCYIDQTTSGHINLNPQSLLFRGLGFSRQI